MYDDVRFLTALLVDSILQNKTKKAHTHLGAAKFADLMNLFHLCAALENGLPVLEWGGA